MTGLENSIKGTVFYVDKNGEYKEVAEIEEINTRTEEYYDVMSKTEAEFEINIKNDYKAQKFTKQMRLLFKSDKERKAERRFNKKTFRNFIKNRR